MHWVGLIAGAQRPAGRCHDFLGNGKGRNKPMVVGTEIKTLFEKLF